MVPPSATRRRVLAGCGAVIGTSVAGCTRFDGHQYTLKSRPKEGSTPVDLFAWRPATNAFHYHHNEEHVESLAVELHETGTVESVEIPLVEERGTGEGGYVPSYTRDDGIFSRVRVRSDPVTLDRWTVWMEPLDELPDDVEYATDPEAEVSGFDSRILRRARREAVIAELEDHDQAAKRAYRRGVVFFEPLDPTDSNLVPDPPFEYALIEPEGHFGPDELPVRLRVREEPVETTRYTHELDPVAASRDELVEHVRAEHVDVRYSAEDVSEAVERIHTEAHEIVGYDEEEPLSEAFESVLADLGLADATLPHGREAASWLRYYEYDDAAFSARLRIGDL